MYFANVQVGKLDVTGGHCPIRDLNWSVKCRENDCKCAEKEELLNYE